MVNTSDLYIFYESVMHNEIWSARLFVFTGFMNQQGKWIIIWIIYSTSNYNTYKTFINTSITVYDMQMNVSYVSLKWNWIIYFNTSAKWNWKAINLNEPVNF